MGYQMVMAEMQKLCDHTHLVPLGKWAKNSSGYSPGCIYPPAALPALPPSPVEVVLAPIRHGEMGRETHWDHRHSKTECFHWKDCWVTSNNSLPSAICPQVVCSSPEDRESVKNGAWPLLQTNTSFWNENFLSFLCFLNRAIIEEKYGKELINLSKKKPCGQTELK